MADSDFWRDLATQFLSVPNSELLHAFGYYTVGSSRAWEWNLRGDTNVLVHRTFDALAARGAAVLPTAKAPSDLITLWLEALREDGTNFRESGQSIQLQQDRSLGQQTLHGTIKYVFQASATLCKKLEASAVGAEFEKKQASNPRNSLAEAREIIANEKPNPKSLRDSYLAKFPDEKLKILDICWAAGQHYREWKRWIAGQAREGATADLAFRRMLNSDKRPQDFKSKPRPDGWQ